MRAVIFANGIMDSWPLDFDLSAEKDLVIAADGGYHHCRRWQIEPHMIIGDMDSVAASDLAEIDRETTQIHRFPQEKDETDLDLAIRAARDRQADQIIILGAMGARWDMSFSNVLVLATPALGAIDARILEGSYEFLCLHGHHKMAIRGKCGDVLSLIPLGGPVTGISLSGAAYPLNRETLAMGTTRGISNCLAQGRVEIEIESGQLLVIICRK